MRRHVRFRFVVPVMVLALLLVGGPVLAATIDVTARTVTTRRIFVDWSNLDPANPEEIDTFRWPVPRLGNLTQSFLPSGECRAGVEYFGEAAPRAKHKLAIVGAGMTGEWTASGKTGVSISSASVGCDFSSGVGVSTSYRFFNAKSSADMFDVSRTFSFGTNEEASSVRLRPYVPRLYPKTTYRYVVHPNAAGTRLVVEDSLDCDFGCTVNDWSGNTAGLSWFAIEDLSTGTGVIVKRDPTAVDVRLWVDNDDASFTNSSSTLLIPPSEGFPGTLTETERYCFFDAGSWPRSAQRMLQLPSGC